MTMIQEMPITRKTENLERTAIALLDAGKMLTLRISEPTFTATEFATWMGVSRTAANKWIREGKVGAEKVGNRYHIPYQEALKFKREHMPALSILGSSKKITKDELCEEIKEWFSQHPGLDESNYMDAFLLPSGDVDTENLEYRDIHTLIKLKNC